MSFIYDLTDTWNNGATVFTSVKMNVTDTNSDAASLLMDLQVAGASKFNVVKNGDVTLAGTLTAANGNGLQVIRAGAVAAWFYNQTLAFLPTIQLQTTINGGANVSVLYPAANGVLRVCGVTDGTGGGVIQTVAYTVATLPAAATAGVGARAFVTDANTTLILGLGLTVVGGGANKVPVYSDGVNWLVG